MIRLASGHVALFTVTERVDSSSPAARVGAEGLTRFGDPAPATPAATIERCFTGGATGARLTETLRGDEARGLAILAPHAGDIETGTGPQADRVYETLAQQGKPVQAWIARGFHPGGARRCWHITSAEISERSFPKLGTLFGADRSFAHAIAFHGHSGTEILVGGGVVEGNSELKEAVRERIERELGKVADVPRPPVVVAPAGPLGGTQTSNIVNRITERGNGIQIEQPFGVRNNRAQRDAIADAVAAVYSELV